MGVHISVLGYFVDSVIIGTRYHLLLLDNSGGLKYVVIT